MDLPDVTVKLKLEGIDMAAPSRLWQHVILVLLVISLDLLVSDKKRVTIIHEDSVFQISRVKNSAIRRRPASPCYQSGRSECISDRLVKISTDLI